MELFTIAEVAKKLKVNPNMVYDLIKHGQLTALKLGCKKVASSELERFIKESSGKDFSDLDNVKELQN